MVVVSEYTGITPDLEQSRTLINLFAEPGGYKRISFSDVYNNKADFDFTDKIVLIGITSPIEHDDYNVPISNEAMPGVEIHANLVAGFIDQNFAGLTIGQSDMHPGIAIYVGFFAGFFDTVFGFEKDFEEKQRMVRGN